MPNETHLKRLISDAVFEAHNTHAGHSRRDRLYISREDSRIIAGAVFDALRRANVLLIDQPGQSNPETIRVNSQARCDCIENSAIFRAKMGQQPCLI
jgi:hypothetical protein